MQKLPLGGEATEAFSGYKRQNTDKLTSQVCLIHDFMTAGVYSLSGSLTAGCPPGDFTHVGCCKVAIKHKREASTSGATVGKSEPSYMYSIIGIWLPARTGKIEWEAEEMGREPNGVARGEPHQGGGGMEQGG